MKTTDRELAEGASDNRFEVAGRILALAEIIREVERVEGADQDGRSQTILRSLAEVTALHGVDFGRGWIQGLWHGQGVRIHQTWVDARALLGEPT